MTWQVPEMLLGWSFIGRALGVLDTTVALVETLFSRALAGAKLASLVCELLFLLLV